MRGEVGKRVFSESPLQSLVCPRLYFLSELSVAALFPGTEIALVIAADLHPYLTAELWYSKMVDRQDQCYHSLQEIQKLEPHIQPLYRTLHYSQISRRFVCIATSEALSSGYSSVQLSGRKKKMDCVLNTHFYLPDLATFSFSVLRLFNLGVRLQSAHLGGTETEGRGRLFFS